MLLVDVGPVMALRQGNPGDRLAGERLIIEAITDAFASDVAGDFSDENIRVALRKQFDFVVTDAARRAVAGRKAGLVYRALIDALTSPASLPVAVGGLGVFSRPAVGGSGSGGLYPVSIYNEPLLSGDSLGWVHASAEILPGSWDGGSLVGSLLSYGDFFPCYFYNKSNALLFRSDDATPEAPALGAFSWFAVKVLAASRVTTTGAVSRSDDYSHSLYFLVGGRVNSDFRLQVETEDIAPLLALGAARFQEYEYSSRFGGPCVGRVEALAGVSNLARQDLYWSRAFGDMWVSQMMRAFPQKRRVVVRPDYFGVPRVDDLKWISAEEFFTRFGKMRERLEEEYGVIFPPPLLEAGRVKSMACRFDAEFIAALGP